MNHEAQPEIINTTELGETPVLSKRKTFADKLSGVLGGICEFIEEIEIAKVAEKSGMSTGEILGKITSHG